MAASLKRSLMVGRLHAGADGGTSEHTFTSLAAPSGRSSPASMSPVTIFQMPCTCMHLWTCCTGIPALDMCGRSSCMHLSDAQPAAQHHSHRAVGDSLPSHAEAHAVPGPPEPPEPRSTQRLQCPPAVCCCHQLWLRLYIYRDQMEVVCQFHHAWTVDHASGVEADQQRVPCISCTWCEAFAGSWFVDSGSQRLSMT